MIVISDCVDFLKALPNESVAMVMCDPPYNIGYRESTQKHHWDKVRPMDEYLAWCEEWTREAVRVLMPNRMLVVWATMRGDTGLRYRLDVLGKSGLTIQNEIIWSYNWGRRKMTNFARKHEVAWCASKGEDFLFNGDDPLVRVPRKLTSGFKSVWKDGKPPTPDTIPTCVWEYNNVTTAKDHVTWHPSPKNMTVIERMVRAWTAPGELVVDPFSGSASTGLACTRTGRAFRGCDINPEYVHLGNERIGVSSSLVTKQSPLRLF